MADPRGADKAVSSGPAPRWAVALEFMRALGGVCLLPLRLLVFQFQIKALRREFEADLSRGSEVEELEPPALPAARPLRIFISCAESSGELHARNLVRALEARAAAQGAPTPEFVGLGGERLAAAGVRLVGEPVKRAMMGFDGVLKAVPYYMGILTRAAEVFHCERPDVCVIVDSPALHVPLARIAKRYDLPVVHFVTPQFWAWGPWRAAPYAKVVDRALTILPFEPEWFRRRGVPVAHVGHPLLDVLASVPATQPPESSHVLAILPGSRESVIERNLPWMLEVAGRLRAENPELRVVIVQDEGRFEDTFRAHVEAAGAGAWATVEVGDLHASLSRARAAFTVSGTILLDLLHHRLPTVVVYRVARQRDVWLYRYIISTPWFSSVNLVAGKQLLPEFCFADDGPVDEVVQALGRCFEDGTWRRECQAELERAAQRLGPPGACRRAAAQTLAVVRGLST